VLDVNLKKSIDPSILFHFKRNPNLDNVDSPRAIFWHLHRAPDCRRWHRNSNMVFRTVSIILPHLQQHNLLAKSLPKRRTKIQPWWEDVSPQLVSLAFLCFVRCRRCEGGDGMIRKVTNSQLEHDLFERSTDRGFPVVESVRSPPKMKMPLSMATGTWK
jgi:hypothetical protein